MAERDRVAIGRTAVQTTDHGSHDGAGMNALVLHGVGDVCLERVPRPRPGPGEALVRTAWCGVCGSDFPRLFVHGAHRHPLICGHEFAGTVVECGTDAGRVRPGDRVVVFPLIWCGHCPACERGLYARCSDYDYLGSRRNGGFAEYVTAPERNLLQVPDNVPLDIAALTEPTAVALHALRRAGGTGAGETVVLLGGGAVGLLVALWARRHGADRVLIFDVDPQKLGTARRLGFQLVFDARETAPPAVVQSLTGGHGAHLVVEAAGVPTTLLQAIEAAGVGGRVVLLGNPSGAATLPPELISRFLRRELSVFGTWNSTYTPLGRDDDWHAALRAVSQPAFDVGPLITHRVSLEQALPLLDRVRRHESFPVRILVGTGA